MKKVDFGTTGLKVPAIVMGCMRMNRDVESAARHIANAVEKGVNFFDHADIYGNGNVKKSLGKH